MFANVSHSRFVITNKVISQAQPKHECLGSVAHYIVRQTLIRISEANVAFTLFLSLIKM